MRSLAAALAAGLLLAGPASAATVYLELPLRGVTTFEIAKPVGSGSIDLTAGWDRMFNVAYDHKPGFETISDFGYSASVSCELSLNCTGSENGLFAGDYIRLTTQHELNRVLVTIRTDLNEFDFCATGSLASTCAVYYQAGVQFDGVASNITYTALPEPGAWALMIGGFGMAGAALRRNRNVKVRQRHARA